MELIPKFDLSFKILDLENQFRFWDAPKIKMEIQEVLFMKHLKICPKCHSNLKLRSDVEIQYCSICGYWTKVGTVRLDSIMIYG